LFFSPNAIDVPGLYWGCHWAGGIVSPANPTYTVEELEFQLKISGAKGLVVHASLLDTTVAAAKRVDIPVARILAVGGHSEAAGVVDVDTMLSDAGATIARPMLDPMTDTAFLVYSSGTTGRPKGAMVTHTNVVAAITLQRHFEEEHLDCTKDRILALLPTFHIFGMSKFEQTSSHFGH
jgi:4-coumarate--CoA ligase